MLTARTLTVVTCPTACVVLLALAGCGGSSNNARVLNGPQVVSAFTRVDIPLARTGTAFGVDDYVDSAFLHGRDGTTNRLEVEVFRTSSLARRVQQLGGNIDTADGRLMRPLAVVQNVVITVFPSGEGAYRTKSLQAVKILRAHTAG